MATKPSPVTVAVGQKITAAGWNDGVAGAWEFLDSTRPVFYAAQSVAQTIPTGTATFTPVTFTSEVIDRDGQHDTAVNPSRVNIGKTLGYYEVSGCVAYAGVASTTAGETRRAGIMTNGSAIPGSDGFQIILPVFTGTNGLISVIVPPLIVQATSASDYVELGAAHTNPGSVGTFVSGGYRSHLRVVYLGS